MGAAQAVLWKEIDSVVFLGEAFEEYLRKEIWGLMQKYEVTLSTSIRVLAGTLSSCRAWDTLGDRNSFGDIFPKRDNIQDIEI